MIEIMQYLAEHEGVLFSNEDLSYALDMNIGTMLTRISKMRNHWVYGEYFRTVRKKKNSEIKVFHYVVKGTKEALKF